MSTTRPPRSINVPGASHKAPIPAAARVGNVICTSAVSGKDPASGKLPDDIASQARNTFANLRAVLQAGGGSLDDVVKLAVTIKDEAVREAVNAEWQAAFPDPQDRPARHIVLHDLQHGMWLQVEAMAVLR
ncbi:RidA family protein [Ramlibacter sp. G-1-2-2]|uniref:RidA family protein n=1 Tax=Ramlibacter agri TaxID=2728837 RepID=A0A848H5E3_9BURK|nr:RidA family protein [Ramlibacter agri]NML44741.1 RidA family protein [Ramlibacter agri]